MRGAELHNVMAATSARQDAAPSRAHGGAAWWWAGVERQLARWLERPARWSQRPVDIDAVSQLLRQGDRLDAASLRAASRALPHRERDTHEREGRHQLDLALALAAQAAERCTGRPAWHTQLQAAAALMRGQWVEMATGEGKTLATALAAAGAALLGHRVHLMTANDYLVRRDAAAARPWWEQLGLSVGVVCADTDPTERERAYRCDITVCTAREVAFDHLRDVSAGRWKVTGLHQRAAQLSASGPDASEFGASGPRVPTLGFALVDEADSLLIDEGSTPLVLSESAAGPAAKVQAARERAMAFQALALARMLTLPDHVAPAPAHDPAPPWRWSREGMAVLERAAAPLGGLWLNRRHRLDQVEHALQALHRLQRDRDYVVRDGAVQIVDAVTGRAAHGRQWSRGLHAMVEAKEGVAVRPPAAVVGRLSLQRFFARYERLAGTSGSLVECRDELLGVFSGRVRVQRLRLPSRRSDLGCRVFATHEARLAALPARVSELVGQGRAVLVATDSVSASGAAVRALAAAGLDAARLDARHDADEAAVVAQAGLSGRVTVATQMAGRGTDIALAASTHQAGGLHVLICQDNRTQRLDRQLAGRSARAGDPGSVETWRLLDSADWPSAAKDLALGSNGIDRCVHAISSRWLHRRHRNDQAAWAPAVLRAWFAWRQVRHEAWAAQARRALLEGDLQWQTRTGRLSMPD